MFKIFIDYTLNKLTIDRVIFARKMKVSLLKSLFIWMVFTWTPLCDFIYDSYI